MEVDRKMVNELMDAIEVWFDKNKPAKIAKVELTLVHGDSRNNTVLRYEIQG